MLVAIRAQAAAYGAYAGGAAAAPAGGPTVTQQILVPKDMAGAIIGKGGTKINEIRTRSGAQVKIDDPQPGANERLVTITGTVQANQAALYMIYERLQEERR